MRIPLWSSKAAPVVVLSVLLLTAAPVVFAQPKPAPAPAAVATTPPSDDELIAIREQLLGLLRTSPTLTQILETDPSLLADQDYINRTNPQLAQFLVQHPEVTRNPDFYLFANLPQPRGRHVDTLQRHTNGNEPLTGEQAQELTRSRELRNFTDLLTFAVVSGALLWLIRMLLQSRRWTRVFHLQSEVHSKLIDRFANNQELLHYMETEPGKRFLEAAPIPIEYERDQRMSGGLARVLGPLQIGVVLTLLGVGLLILQHSLPDDAAPLLVFGMIAMMPGIGFIISAIVTWRISARLGLMPQSTGQPSASATDLPGRQ